MKRFLRIGLFIALMTLPCLVLAEQPADAGFTPLTSIPFIEDAGNADTLPDFLNGLYKLCIGLAAALAVLQIMRAGVMYMGGDSVTEKKEARNLIGLSIGGLVLVLSPVIVFSIINPDILSLKIDGIKDLAPTPHLTEEVRNTTLWTDDTSGRAVAKARCDSDGGTAFFICRPKGDPNAAGRSVPIDVACTAETEVGVTVCRSNATTPAAGVCKAGAEHQASNKETNRETCDASQGYSQVARTCCGAGLADTAVCCERTPPPPPDISQTVAVVKYEILALTGTGTDAGPTSATKETYTRFKAACVAAGKELKEEFAAKRHCTDSETAGYTGGESSKPYLWCVPTTISCVAN